MLFINYYGLTFQLYILSLLFKGSERKHRSTLNVIIRTFSNNYFRRVARGDQNAAHFVVFEKKKKIILYNETNIQYTV